MCPLRVLIKLHRDVPTSFRYLCCLISRRIFATPFTRRLSPRHNFTLSHTPAKTPLFRTIKTPVLLSYWFAWWSLVRAQRFHSVPWPANGRAIKTPVLVSHWFARESPAVSFCPTASQWQLRYALPFRSCFSYNPKFSASLLLGLPPVFTLVCPKRRLTLK
jgi:hypothetical protein